MAKSNFLLRAFGTVSIIAVSVLAVLIYGLYQNNYDIITSETTPPISVATTSLSSHLAQFKAMLDPDEMEEAMEGEMGGASRSSAHSHSAMSTHTADEAVGHILAIAERVEGLIAHGDFAKIHAEVPSLSPDSFLEISQSFNAIGDEIASAPPANVPLLIASAEDIADELSTLLHKLLHVIIEDDVIGDEFEIFRDSQTSLRKQAGRSMLVSLLAALIALAGLAYMAFVNARNSVLTQANEELIRRTRATSEAKSRLLTMLSHEIRNPMNGITGLTTLLIQNKNIDQQQQFLEQIRNSATDMVRFLDDILEFSDLSEQSGNKDQQLILTRQLFTALADKLAEVARRFDASISIDIDPAMPPILVGDRYRIYQAAFYLCSHLIQHSGARDLALEFRYEDRELGLKCDLRLEDGEANPVSVAAIDETHRDDAIEINSDALEATLFRGLIEALAGRVRVLKKEGDALRFRLIAFIPIGEFEQKRAACALVGADDGLRSAIEHYLSPQRIEWVDNSALARASIIFCQITGNAPDVVAGLRRVVPNALIIGLPGIDAPEPGEAFDLCIDALEDGDGAAPGSAALRLVVGGSGDAA